jgi:hypothetical protein
MNTNTGVSAVDPVATLDQHLQAGAALANFDMDDVPELPWLKPFPPLHDALAWLDEHVTALWRGADAAAIQHQIRHEWLARTAAATGAGAIILAVVQLALKQSRPGFTFIAAWIEGMTVLAGVISVGVGLWAKSDRKWLGCRHRAERLRMLKFRALARTELWSGQDAEWKAWVEGEIAALPAPDNLDHMEHWSKDDALITEMRENLQTVSIENERLEGVAASALEHAANCEQAKVQADAASAKTKADLENQLSQERTALIRATDQARQALEQLAQVQTDRASEVTSLRSEVDKISGKAHALELELVRARALLETRDKSVTG